YRPWAEGADRLDTAPVAGPHLLPRRDRRGAEGTGPFAAAPILEPLADRRDGCRVEGTVEFEAPAVAGARVDPSDRLRSPEPGRIARTALARPAERSSNGQWPEEPLRPEATADAQPSLNFLDDRCRPERGCSSQATPHVKSWCHRRDRRRHSGTGRLRATP